MGLGYLGISGVIAANNSVPSCSNIERASFNPLVPIGQIKMKAVSQNNLSTRIPARGAAIKPFAPVMERLLALEVLERPKFISDAGREHPAPA